jgi:hypothetical protein
VLVKTLIVPPEPLNCSATPTNFCGLVPAMAETEKEVMPGYDAADRMGKTLGPGF